MTKIMFIQLDFKPENMIDKLEKLRKKISGYFASKAYGYNEVTTCLSSHKWKKKNTKYLPPDPKFMILYLLPNLHHLFTILEV